MRVIINQGPARPAPLQSSLLPVFERRDRALGQGAPPRSERSD